MTFIIASAAFIGFVHSLAPGHWLPVVLVAKSRKWSAQTTALGASVAAFGHIVISNLLGASSIWLGARVLSGSEETVERYGSVLLILFGLFYAGWAYFRHSHCHGHSHHGPDPQEKSKTPFTFLFSLGFSPCVAVLPVFGAASLKGVLPVLVSMISFSAGVLAALIGSTLLASKGLSRLDHPLLEHYGDVITGLTISLMGLVLFLFPI